jgi:hypothetical protein
MATEITCRYPEGKNRTRTSDRRRTLEPAANVREGKRLPLWLSLAEARTLAALCGTSPLGAGPHETALFERLGGYLVSFRRADRSRRDRRRMG